MKDKFSRVWGDLVNNENVGLSNIRECSYDKDNDMYLIDSKKDTINFDKASEVLAKKLRVNKPSSVDSLYVQDEMLYLVEFKNTFDPKPDEIRVKVHDTLAILKLSEYITDSDYSFIKIIIVRKRTRKVEEKIRGIKKAGKVPKAKMGLDFLQLVYPRVEFFDMNPNEYKKFINNESVSEVSSCTQ